MISRAQFFSLTKLDSDGHTSLKRRDQLPVINANDREYTPFQAYAFILADHFAQSPDGHGMNRTMACDIVRDMLVPLIERAADIEATAKTFRCVEGFEKILAGRVTVSGGRAPFVGTPAELAELMTREDVLDVMLVNATAGLVVLQYRATREVIDLTQMWPDPKTFQTAEERREDVRASWKAAVSRVNAKRQSGEGEA